MTLRVLFVSHCPSANTRELREAALQGIASLELPDVDVAAKDPLDADAEDVAACDGIIIGTTENFGAMAGRIKDFFERIYYPCLEDTQGLPCALYIRAGEDGRGTRSGIGKIVTGLRWKYVHEPLILRGSWSPAFREQVAELAMTMAAGLDADIF